MSSPDKINTGSLRPSELATQLGTDTKTLISALNAVAPDVIQREAYGTCLEPPGSLIDTRTILWNLTKFIL